MTSSKLNLRKPPKFLKILGAEGYDFDEANQSISMTFNVSDELTHSDGAIVQGGLLQLC